MSKCPHCSKTFKSKSGLRRHVKAQHPFDPPIVTDKAAPHEEPLMQSQDVLTDKAALGEADAVIGPSPSDETDLAHLMVTDDQDARSKHDDDNAMIKALKALAIKPADVMSYRVYPDKVVIIEGPTGWKRVWKPEEK